MKRALLCTSLALALAGCCKPDPVGGVMVINNTDTPITFAVETSDKDAPVYGPWTAEPGLDNMAVALPGPADIVITAASGEQTRISALFKLDLITIIAARPDSCLALAEYTRQYGGDGVVEVLAVVSPSTPGSIEYLGGTYLGPRDKLPLDILEDKTVARFTEVPCDLIDDKDRLARHLYHLD